MEQINAACAALRLKSQMIVHHACDPPRLRVKDCRAARASVRLSCLVSEHTYGPAPPTIEAGACGPSRRAVLRGQLPQGGFAQTQHVASRMHALRKIKKSQPEYYSRQKINK